MNQYHKNLTLEDWQRFTFFEQMANVGSEIFRAINWRSKNKEYSQMAFERALELLELTIADVKNIHRLKELVRVKEVLADYFQFDNLYNSTDAKWQGYFYAFNYAARLKR